MSSFSIDPLDTPSKSHNSNDLSKIDFKDLKTSTPEKTSISGSIIDSHPELNLAIEQDIFNPVKGANVLFSPSEMKRRRRRSDSSCTGGSGGGPNGPNGPNGPGPNDGSHIEGLVAKFIRHLADPTTPYLLSLYLQVIFNSIIVSLIAYLIYIFVTTIKSDINRKIEVYTTDILEEISTCTREYYRNKCSPDKRAPILEQSCNNWQKCMNRDPQLLARSKITAETFADIVNGFIKPISWKSLFFLNFLIWGSLIITNVVFGSYRANKVEVDTVRSLQKRINELEVDQQQQKLKHLEQENNIVNKTYMY